MERFLMDSLKEWKLRENRKPLVIMGGKTGRQNLAYEGVWAALF